MRPAVAIEPLSPHHDRKGFTCGVEALDRYLREQASQDVKRRISNCFVAIGPGGAIVGYYTFAAASLPIGDLPADLAKRLPRYPLVPAALIGRLAVARAHRGKRLGGALVMDAVLRAARADPAIFAVLVDAKDDAASAFYQHLGFRPFTHRPRSLFVSVATALRAFEDGR